MKDTTHIFPIHSSLINRGEKEQFLNQRSKVFWMTGLSGSGKSTIAAAVEKKLFSKGYFVQVLDGDNTRKGVSSNLGFSIEDRKENIRRIAEVSTLFLNCGIICLNSFVSPTHLIREKAREIIGKDDFKLIYIKASLSLCEKRDVKGLYKKARAGVLKGFTGIDSPYEEPMDPNLVIDTESMTLDESVDKLSKYIYTQI